MDNPTSASLRGHPPRRSDGYLAGPIRIAARRPGNAESRGAARSSHNRNSVRGRGRRLEPFEPAGVEPSDFDLPGIVHRLDPADVAVVVGAVDGIAAVERDPAGGENRHDGHGAPSGAGRVGCKLGSSVIARCG